MTRFISRLRILALTFVLALPGATFMSRAPAASAQSTEANVTRLTASILAQSQFSHHPLDRELAAKFFDRYLDALDGTRSLFLQSDVQQFSKSSAALVHDTVDTGDTHPSQVIWQRYLERLRQRAEFVRDQLQHAKFDFTGHDSYEIDRDDSARPADIAAAHKLWLTQLRAEYLDQKLSDVAPDQIVKKLERRYQVQVQTMQALSRDEVTTLYLNALASVYDPHSEYLGHEQMQSFEMMMNLSLFGIGATLESTDGYCTVREVLPGGPAAHSPLKAGDRIIAVAQANKPAVDITHVSLSQAVQLIRGPKGSRVTLTVLPPGSDAGPTKLVSIVRDEVQLQDQRAKASVIDLPSEKGTMRLGVIDLPSFYAGMDPKSEAHTRSATDDIARLLTKLKAEKVRGIVLDLRRNGGGSLDEAIRLTGLFIPKGPVVQTRSPSGHIDVETDPDPSELYKGPLVVLTSRMSASASEILAGALQDYGRAVVVGDSSTFGKGTVQNIMPLAPIMREHRLAFSSDPGALKVTVRKFYRPSGASTQLRGVTSDIVIPSFTDVSEISEAAQKDPLPWDVVPPAPYKRENLVAPYLAQLRERSRQRVAAEKGFADLQASTALARERLKDNHASLNETERRQEQARDKQRQSDLEQAWQAEQQQAPKARDIKLSDSSALVAAQPSAFGAFEDTEHAEAEPQSERDAVRADSAANDLILYEAVHILADYANLMAVDQPQPVPVNQQRHGAAEGGAVGTRAQAPV